MKKKPLKFFILHDETSMMTSKIKKGACFCWRIYIILLLFSEVLPGYHCPRCQNAELLFIHSLTVCIP